MQELIEQVCLLFRLGMDAKANDRFARFMDLLAQELSSMSEGVDANTLNLLLNEMFLAQSRTDYLYLADLLEYEIGPRIDVE